jgi:hypothetical protein
MNKLEAHLLHVRTHLTKDGTVMTEDDTVLYDTPTWANTVWPGAYRGQLSVASCGVYDLVEVCEDGYIVSTREAGRVKNPWFWLSCAFHDKRSKFIGILFNGNSSFRRTKLMVTSTGSGQTRVAHAIDDLHELKFKLNDADRSFIKDVVALWVTEKLPSTRVFPVAGVVGAGETR